jgi:hypothetical protein
MSHIDKGMWGVVALSLGGGLLMFTIFTMLDNMSNPVVIRSLLLWSLVVPLSLVSFFMLGWGLLMIIRARDKSTGS